MRKSVFALLTFLMILWAPAVTWGQISEVQVGVDGMTCVT